jgi:hypothetical protein
MNAQHGVFAPTSRLRDKVVPRPASTSDAAEPPAEPQVSMTSPPPSSPKSTSVPSTVRLDWAALLLRVFGGAPRVPSRSMSSSVRAVRARCASSPASRIPMRRGVSSSTSGCEPKHSPPGGPSHRPSPSSSFLPPEPHLGRRRPCVDGSGASGPPEIGASIPTHQVFRVPQQPIGRAALLAPVTRVALFFLFARATRRACAKAQACVQVLRCSWLWSVRCRQAATCPHW